MTWYTATTANIGVNGTVVSVNTGDDISLIQENSGLIFEGESPVQVKRGYIDGSGNKFIELQKPWPYNIKTNEPLVVYPTDANFAEATAELRRIIDSLSVATTIDAQQGVNDEKVMTPKKVKTAIDHNAAEQGFLVPDDLVPLYPYAIRKAEFEARRAANNEKFAASGFVHFGKRYLDTWNNGFVRSLYSPNLGSSEVPNNLFMGSLVANAAGDSKVGSPIINIAGVVTKIENLSSSNTDILNKIKFPEAEDGTRTYDSATGTSVTHATTAIAFASETATNKVVTDRVDMWGILQIEQEINDSYPFVYKNGLPQSSATTMNGVATTTNNIQPIDYFAQFAGDTGSRGRGVNWQTATETQRATLANDPKNKIYFNDATGKFYQTHNFSLSFKGLGNGDWSNIDAITGDLAFSAQSKIVPSAAINATKFSVGTEVGLFTANNNPNCHFLVCGTVNRIQSGIYHPSFNPFGSAKASDDKDWSQTSVSFTSKSDCFDSSKLLAGSGSIASVKSGRPDGRYYDAVYASGQGGVCRDMRYSAWGLKAEDFAEADLNLKSGEYRGRELLKFTRVFASAGDVENGYTIINQDNAAAIVAIKTLTTSVSDEFSHTDVQGPPDKILVCDYLASGWVGSWLPDIPDGVKDEFALTRPYVGTGSDITRTHTLDNGATWTQTATAIGNAAKNTVTVTNMPNNQVTVWQYKTKAKLTTSAVRSKPYCGKIGSILATMNYSISRGALLSFSAGVFLKTSVASHTKAPAILDAPLLGGEFTVAAGYDIEHHPLSLPAPNYSSPAFKALNYNVVENQQGFINYAYTELKHDGTDWGDDGKIHIADNQTTMLDENGNTVVVGTDRCVEPLGWIKNDK